MQLCLAEVGSAHTLPANFNPDLVVVILEHVLIMTEYNRENTNHNQVEPLPVAGLIAATSFEQVSNEDQCRAIAIYQKPILFSWAESTHTSNIRRRWGLFVFLCLVDGHVLLGC